MLTDEQSKAIDAVCAKLTPTQAVDLGDHIRALRSIQWNAATPAVHRAAEQAGQCGCCNGTGWVTRDPDIGTDQECWCCNGSGVDSEAAIPRASDAADWKAAVDTELVTTGSTADSFTSPREAVKALIDWHVSVALDPAVSRDAQSLIDKGATPAQEVAQPCGVCEGDCGAEISGYACPAKPEERTQWQVEIDRLRNDLAAAKQDAATAWERHAMANRIATALQEERARLATYAVVKQGLTTGGGAGGSAALHRMAVLA